MISLKLIILISDINSTGQILKSYVPQDFVLLEGSADNRGAELLKNISSGIVLVDTNVAGALSWMKEVYPFKPDLTYIGITGDERKTNDLFHLFYEILSPPFNPAQVQNLLNRSWERTVLLMQKNMEHGISVERRSRNYAAGSAYSHKEHILCKFSRALGTDFNCRHLIDLFLSMLEELVPVNKISLLLAGSKDGVYEIAAQRGLDLQIASKLRFHANGGLIAWLSREGRILYSDGRPAQGLFVQEALQEMSLLHSLISIPLLARGRLVGALNLGPKVTGYLYSDDELEILYMLSGNVATALLDIDLHHQLRYQKLYTENILLRMNSGVIGIDMHDKITTFNERAAEILKMNSSEVMQKDLRCLPSPLGDMLYRTRSSGEGCDREKLELVKNRLPLEISTYQLVDEGDNILGSVMIFDNISERRQLELERRKADQLDVLNRFVGQLAHEIKNPMVAILTFAELLPEKYSDESFREQFAGTVQKEVKRLNDLVEQLIDFSTPLSYKYSVEDIHEIVEQGLLLVQEQDSTVEVTIKFTRHEKKLLVRADRTLLSRAFAYLIHLFGHTLSRGNVLFIQVELRPSLFAEGGISLSFRSPEAKLEKEHVEKIFDPLLFPQEQSISLGLPVSRKIVEDHGGRMKASLSRDGYLIIDVELPITDNKAQVKSLD